MSGERAEQGPPVAELAQGFLKQAERSSKALSKVVAALKKLADQETLESPRKVVAAVKVLESARPSAPTTHLEFRELLGAVAADQERRAAARRLSFGRDLKEKAGSENLACRLLTSDPMEFDIPPFTLAVDLQDNTATLRYCRPAVEELPAEPEKVVAALRKNHQRLESGWAPEAFFDALFESYRLQLFCRKLPQGERVRLADLPGQVALAYQGRKFRTDPVAGNFRSYGRVRFAYDLVRLKRTGTLERNGFRLNLGTATGSSTRRKEEVLYLENMPGQGEYYLTAWFTTQQRKAT